MGNIINTQHFSQFLNSSLVMSASGGGGNGNISGGGGGTGGDDTKTSDDVEVAIDPGICQPRSQAFSEQVIEGQCARIAYKYSSL